MTTLKAALLATVFATSATIALGQVSVDAGVGASVDGTVSAGSNDNSTSVDTGVDASVAADAKAGASSDTDATAAGTYADLSATLTSTTSTNLSAISGTSDINIVMISSVEGEADGSAWAKLKADSESRVKALQSEIEQNAPLNARLTAELSSAGDFTIDDVVAISTSADGSLTVYVDDEN